MQLTQFPSSSAVANLLGGESQVADANMQLTQFPSSSAVANLIGGESQVACTNKQLTQSSFLGGENAQSVNGQGCLPHLSTAVSLSCSLYAIAVPGFQ